MPRAKLLSVPFDLGTTRDEARRHRGDRDEVMMPTPTRGAHPESMWGRKHALTGVVLSMVGCGADHSPPRGIQGGDSAPGGAVSGSTSGVEALSCGMRSVSASGLTVGSNVIVAVDSSGSMAGELPDVRQVVAAQLPALGAKGARVVLLGSACSPSTLCPTLMGGVTDDWLMHLDSPIGSTDALSVIVDRLAAFGPQLPAAAPTHVVVFTDDDAAHPAIARSISILSVGCASATYIPHPPDRITRRPASLVEG
jgi:hypothetical protein